MVIHAATRMAVFITFDFVGRLAAWKHRYLKFLLLDNFAVVGDDRDDLVNGQWSCNVSISVKMLFDTYANFLILFNYSNFT